MEVAMADLTVDLDDFVFACLLRMAAESGRSVEDEARRVLIEAITGGRRFRRFPTRSEAPLKRGKKK
jgi:plasmid stability protein